MDQADAPHVHSERLPQGVSFFYLNKNKSSNTMKPTPRQYKEAVDRHDKIVKHLIDEGYAENPEMADNIIMGMSEEWYNQIID